jgi:mRNA interferase MazF
MAEKLIRRGEIYWVDLPDNNGREVISNDKQNLVSPLITVIPITSLKLGDKVFSFQVSIQLKKESVVLVDQIQTIDRDKFLDRVAKISEGVMEKVEECIHLTLALKN